VTFAFRVYFLPIKGGLVLIKQNGIEVIEGTMQNLIAAVEEEPYLGEIYLF
jgi:hypothetical protein